MNEFIDIIIIYFVFRVIIYGAQNETYIED